MEKKLSSILLVLLIILCCLTIPVIAAGTLTLSTTSAAAGDTLTASGISAPNIWVAVKVLDSSGNIIFYDNVKSGTSGEYSCAFKIPAGTEGTLNVIVGYGSNVASASMIITQHSGNSGGNSGSSSNNNTGNDTGTKTEIGSHGEVIIETPSVNNSTGNAKVEVSKDILDSAFMGAKPGQDGVRTAVIDIPQAKGARGYETTLPASFLAAGDTTKEVEIRTSLASITVPGNMLGAADGQNVSLTVASGDKTKLEADVQVQIGSRPVIELNLKIDGKPVSWSNESAPVTVSIPYKPTADELKDPENITVWYIDGSGKAVSVPTGRYDPATGKVTFSTTHFSQYVVAFVQKTFEDINNYSWAKKQIEVLASKGIINGTSGSAFSPADSITRADYIVLLIRTLGLTADVEENFEDIRPGMYYYKEIGIAKKLGVASGAGNNEFSPNAFISRQDMMVLTARALEKLKRLENAPGSKELDKFTDKDNISEYAVGSLVALIREGLIAGSGNRIKPLDNTSRAEAAVFLYRIYNR